jgi:hypothetical protein
VHAGKCALDDSAGAQIQGRQTRQIGRVKQPGPRWFS